MYLGGGAPGLHFATAVRRPPGRRRHLGRKTLEEIRVVCAHDCPDCCSLIAHVDEGKGTRVVGDPDHPFTDGFACAKVNRDAELVNSPERLATPLRRTGPKGGRAFEPISWDDALDEITARWTSIIAEHGAEALLGYAYSAHQGMLNRQLTNGLFHALGASRLNAGTVCDSCCSGAWESIVGAAGGTDPETVTDSDLVISWGCDLMAVNVHFWAKLQKLRDSGVKLVVIDPRRSQTAARADWHLPIRIGTDAALAIGIAHILIRDGLVDEDYLAAHALGYDQFAEDIVPRFTPAYVAEVTGLSVDDVERLAAMYGAAKRSFIRLGEGMTRLANGGQALRAVCVLPAMTGAYGRRGGGALLVTPYSMPINLAALSSPNGPSATRVVNHSRLGEALLSFRDPPIQGLFIAANNPAVTCPDVLATRRGLAREDLFTVVHDPFMTMTARYADIVLPASTYLETADVYRSYGAYYMQYAPAAGAPVGEAWSNLRLTRELARRMGLDDPVFGATDRELVATLFEDADETMRHIDPETFMEAGPIKVPQDDAQSFATPSGKLEIYSASLEAAGVSPLPDWRPDAEELADAERWPLRLLTAPSYFTPHTAYEGVEFLRKREGPVRCVVHPEEAARRALGDGDRVLLRNDRATISMLLDVSDEVQPGVVLVPGQRTDVDDVSGSINMLCSDRYTDIGEGATYQSTFLDVLPAN
jgi:anaerobic selenocysteine-containing dehydrogenase